MELDVPANGQPDAVKQQPINQGSAEQPTAAPAAALVPAAAAAADDVVVKKQAKRKVAMHLAYLGAGYHVRGTAGRQSGVSSDL